VSGNGAMGGAGGFGGQFGPGGIILMNGNGIPGTGGNGQGGGLYANGGRSP